ncbi:hypothetical protein XENTR_v10016854 [Xenopus tropicalis]|nr:hypothetical protein XENTR_v10016854 [Xenopus tropicalis]KAE8598528.1 hypothetical protein XENTR_v10016854 [Xenopus tropicalis]
MLTGCANKEQCAVNITPRLYIFPLSSATYHPRAPNTAITDTDSSTATGTTYSFLISPKMSSVFFRILCL